ncbi:unnamed protein product, partial [Allacma fusca]
DITAPTSTDKVNGDIFKGNVSENKYLTERYFAKVFTYLRNSPAFKNATKQDIIDLVTELESWEPPERLIQNLPYYLAGYDLDDRPVWVAEVGKYDLRAEVELGEENIQACLKYLFLAVHRIVKSIYDRDTPEREIRNAVFIIDLEGFDLLQFSHTKTISLCLRLTRDYKEVTQEFMGNCVFVNVNHIGELAAALFRPILGSLMERMQLFGTNKAKWIPHLRRMLPENVIPAWYGGSKDFKPIQIYG